MVSNDVQIDFKAPASLRKWSSINNPRGGDTVYPGPYLLFDGTLQRMHTTVDVQTCFAASFIRNTHRASAAIGQPVLSTEHVAELARLREFLSP
jgi:hypothetical protein